MSFYYSHAIITLVEKIVRALDTGKIVVGVYLDLRKAFDAITDSILLKKLYALGIRGNIYDWVKSYLTNISQFVLYNNGKSETKFISHVVLQGSILGPLFVIVFMNYFSRVSKLLLRSTLLMTPLFSLKVKIIIMLFLHEILSFKN